MKRCVEKLEWKERWQEDCIRVLPLFGHIKKKEKQHIARRELMAKASGRKSFMMLLRKTE